MITAYIQAAMRHVHYELLEDQTYYGEIDGLQGVYANETSLERCREQLQEVLEGWILLGLRLGHPIPVLDGITLHMQLELAWCRRLAQSLDGNCCRT